MAFPSSVMICSAAYHIPYGGCPGTPLLSMGRPKCSCFKVHFKQWIYDWFHRHASSPLSSSIETYWPSSSSSPANRKPTCCVHRPVELEQNSWSPNTVLQRCTACALATAMVASLYCPLSFAESPHVPNNVFSDLAVLISGPPIKDPNALLRYALPIDNKSIKDVQRSLEDITDSLKLAGAKAFDPASKNVRQAARALSQSKSTILASLPDLKKEAGQALLDKLTTGLQDLQKIIEDRNRDAIGPKQRELLYTVGDVEEAMVEKFPFEVPEEYASKPLLKGRARVEMKVKVKDNPNLKGVVFEMVLDGYNAPVTAGNFIDLVERHFYDGMEIQRADGFVVQTGNPDGPSEGFVDPGTEKMRTIPLEIMVDGDKRPIYEASLEELGRYKARTKLPFNAFGTLAMAREEFEDNSASSQIFWLLKESELTPSNANILDGRYAVFGYITENEGYLADLKVGDVIESMKVVAGLDNLVNPTYKLS